MSEFTKRIKRRLRFNSKTNTVVLFLFVMFLFIGVGFAYINTTLSVDGVTNVESSSWDIHFNNIVVTNGSVEATTQPTISNQTTVSFGVDLENPGDFYEFTVDVVNDGTLDAKIDSLSILPTLTSEQQEYFDYIVKYVDGGIIQLNDALNAGVTETIKVRFEYKTNDDTTLYPEDDVDFNFSVTLDYLQGEGSAIARPYVYTVNMFPTTVSIGSAIPGGVTIYNTYQEAYLAFGHNFFLKHKVESNQITESYVGFIYNNNDYYLRGAGATYNSQTGNYNNDSPYYANNKATLIGAFGSSSCTIDGSCGTGCLYTECSSPGLYVYVNTFGNVDAYLNNYICIVFSTGSSTCADQDIG